MRKINLTGECKRLKKALLKSPETSSYEFYKKPVLSLNIEHMSDEDKIEFLAWGFLDGWYGEYFVPEVMLGNLYEDVRNKYNELKKEYSKDLDK